MRAFMHSNLPLQLQEHHVPVRLPPFSPFFKTRFTVFPLFFTHFLSNGPQQVPLMLSHLKPSLSSTSFSFPLIISRVSTVSTVFGEILPCTLIHAFFYLL